MISRQILKMKEDYIDLFTLQSHVKEAVEGNFTDLIWVKAEIAGISCRQNGHCYMDLSQSRNGQVVAKARATVWAFRWNLIDRQFRSVTGSALVAGMEILAAVKVNYHPVYGFSLNVDDIDPEFTLGLGERKRRETIERLAGEGLLDVQKGLRLPALPYSLAVISAKGAAGYGDFRHHLLDNEYGFAFNVKLFEALMQGNEAPASIVRALSEIISSLVHYDAILIMRGGGSELDLACFDDYDLAATIARCPLPVITAIGHDKDHHVADMVAYASVKTPTALADLFLGLYIAQDQYLVKMSSRLTMLFNNRLSAMGSALDLVRSRILAQTESRLSRAESKVDNLALTVSGAASGRLSAGTSPGQVAGQILPRHRDEPAQGGVCSGQCRAEDQRQSRRGGLGRRVLPLDNGDEDLCGGPEEHPPQRLCAGSRFRGSEDGFGRLGQGGGQREDDVRRRHGQMRSLRGRPQGQCLRCGRLLIRHGSENSLGSYN